MLLFLYEDKTNKTVLYCSNNQKHYIEQPVMDCIKMLCIHFGSTYQGRKDAIKFVLQIKQKVPILLSETNKNIIFPTVSNKRKDCFWIHANAVTTFHQIGKSTKIKFISGDEYIFNIDYRTIKKQMQRCRQFQLFLDMHLFENLL